MTHRLKIGALLLAVIISIIIYAGYQPGKSGALFYDDYANLDALSNIENITEIKQFITSGHAGPLGRPVSLLTFTLQAESWPDRISDFIAINILIHIGNALLLFLLSILIIKRFVPDSKEVVLIAFTAALLWGVMPILASTSLIVVQRMTGLSAFFGLLALIVYVYFYRVERFSIFVLQGLLFLVFFFLSIYSKESGFLVPIFALVLDRVMASSSGRSLSQGSNIYIKIRLFLLILYLALIVYYLSPLNREWFLFSESRGYSPWERLGTQSVILWDYIFLTLAPNPTAFGPFHDDVKIIRSQLIVALGATSLLAMLIGAMWLKRITIWPLFAIVWFLVGHLLESTVINLELYFEHRNYLAVYGLALMVAVLVWNIGLGKRRLYIGVLYIYILLNWSILYGLTNIWGNPVDAAENWAAKKPESARAAIHLAVLDTGLDNIAEQQVDIVNFYRRENALRALDRTAQYCTDCLDVRIQGLLYACVNNTDDIVERYYAILQNANSARVNISIVDGLFPLRELVSNAGCSGIDKEMVLNLTLELIEAEGYLSNSLKVRLYFIAAMISDDMMNDSDVIDYLDKAEDISIVALPILEYQIKKYTELEKVDMALAAIDRRLEYGEKRNYSNINKEYLLELRSSLVTEY